MILPPLLAMPAPVCYLFAAASYAIYAAIVTPASIAEPPPMPAASAF
jgi:hypothetical protein